jgi:hypothetical protein
LFPDSFLDRVDRRPDRIDGTLRLPLWPEMADPRTTHQGAFQMNTPTRRVFMIQVAAASGAFVTARASAAAPRLKETDPEAVAVAYALDANKVDKARFPKRMATDRCGTCKAFIVKPGEEWGACALIEEKSVNGAGWCSSYVKK